MKIGGSEIPRERWDAADPAQQEDPEDSLMFVVDSRPGLSSVLPDWTRSLLPNGAPPAVIRAHTEIQVSSPATAVGA
jgi:actin-related protein 10